MIIFLANKPISFFILDRSAQCSCFVMFSTLCNLRRETLWFIILNELLEVFTIRYMHDIFLFSVLWPNYRFI
jgi:hypothetical protein